MFGQAEKLFFHVEPLPPPNTAPHPHPKVSLLSNDEMPTLQFEQEK